MRTQPDSQTGELGGGGVCKDVLSTLGDIRCEVGAPLSLLNILYRHGAVNTASLTRIQLTGTQEEPLISRYSNIIPLFTALFSSHKLKPRTVRRCIKQNPQTMTKCLTNLDTLNLELWAVSVPLFSTRMKSEKSQFGIGIMYMTSAVPV